MQKSKYHVVMCRTIVGVSLSAFVVVLADGAVARFDGEKNRYQTRESGRSRTTDIENPRRRNLFRIAAAYSVSAWVILRRIEISQ